MKENFPGAQGSNQQEVKSNSEAERPKKFGMEDHAKFMSTEVASFGEKFGRVLGGVAVGFGAMLVVSAAYEFLTGHKEINLLSYDAPTVLRAVFQRLSDMPIVLKAGGGAAVMSFGPKIIDFFKTKKENPNKN